MEMSFSQMKPLILIIPALAILTPVLHDSFPRFAITLPFSLPIFVQQLGMLFDLSVLSDFNKFLNWRDTFGPVGWFWVSVLFFSLGKSLLMAIYNKIKPALGFLPTSAQNAAPETQKNPTPQSPPKQEGEKPASSHEGGKKEKN